MAEVLMMYAGRGAIASTWLTPLSCHWALWWRMHNELYQHNYKHGIRLLTETKWSRFPKDYLISGVARILKLPGHREYMLAKATH